MLVSTKGRYALRLAIYIASRAGEGAVSLREASEHEGISLKYLEQLARPLVAAGILASVRGKGGGYVLARPAADVLAGDVLRAAEGTVAPVGCAGLGGGCERAGACPAVGFWSGLDAVVERYVDGVTVADLVPKPVS